MSSIQDLINPAEIPAEINTNLTCPTPEILAALLGMPRSSFSDACQPVTNKKLQLLLTTKNVGPFTVTGLRPAVEGLAGILAEVKTEQPAVYSALGTAGMLGCRLIRGKNTGEPRKISSHSWGTAIDLTIENVLDSRGDGKAQYGLILISDIFNRNGWYWGAGFRNEDSMHFEVSRQKLEEWERSGIIGGARRSVISVTLPKLKLANGFSGRAQLHIGCRGGTVKELQYRLKQRGASLKVDGVFGARTENAVKALQRAYSLRPDGVVGAQTRRVIGWR
jgi:hypothetical protein